MVYKSRIALNDRIDLDHLYSVQYQSSIPLIQTSKIYSTEIYTMFRRVKQDMVSDNGL
jgi:hypothetical protein